MNVHSDKSPADISGECVLMCPSGYFGYRQDRVCVKQCPSGFYGYEEDRTCV